MGERREYCLDLAKGAASGASAGIADLQLRAVQADDKLDLAELMVDAYRGTVDDEGETLEDAVAEVRAYLAGERGGPPLLTASRIAMVGSRMIGACLVAEWRHRQQAIVTYVMTRAEWKNRGVARQIVQAVLEALGGQGYRDIRAIITNGNTSSERLFARLGFEQVPAAST